MNGVSRSLLLAFVAIFFGMPFSRAQADSGIITAGNARFTIITPTLIRIEYDTNKKFVDAPSLFAMNRDQRQENVKVIRTADQVEIETGAITLTYTDDGKPLTRGNLKAIIHSDKGEITWTPEMKNTSNLGGTLHNLDHVKGPVPVDDGLLSRDGWHVIDDSQRFILINDWVAQRPKGSGTDWYLFGYGDDYKLALRDLTTVGGPVPLPRKYVLGAWYSRWWPYTSQDYRKIVQQFHEHDFPLDVIVNDMDWHKTNSWTGYSWNTDLFPDAPEYLKFLHDNRLFVTLNDHPQGGVGTYEDRYPQFMTAMGKNFQQKEVIPYDNGNRHYMENVFKYMHDPLEKMGVDFWWVDWMGDANFTFDRMDWVNELYFRHSMENGLRGQQFSRWGDWGDHRHPIHFSGDTYITWPTLQFEVPFTATSSNSGLFYWTHDMGGFTGTRNGELLARWVQFGALSAALRLHSTRNPLLDKRPWSYNRKIEDSMRVSFHLHSEIFPYIYSSAWEGTQSTLPLVRSLYLEYPKEENAYHFPQEYLFGDALLVAPITSPGSGLTFTASQKVWFPPGDWYDWFTGERHDGQTQATVTKDLNSFPLYVKGGVPVPMQAYAERMTTEPLTDLVIRAYPGTEGQEGAFTLYEDDGVTRDYENNGRATTHITYLREARSVTITVEPTDGSYNGQQLVRRYDIQLPQSEHAELALIDGKTYVPVVYDIHTRTNNVMTPPLGIRQKFVVQFKFGE